MKNILDFAWINVSWLLAYDTEGNIMTSFQVVDSLSVFIAMATMNPQAQTLRLHQ